MEPTLAYILPFSVRPLDRLISLTWGPEHCFCFGIKSGIENHSKSEVIGLCGGDEKNEWPRGTDKSRTLKKKKLDAKIIQK